MLESSARMIDDMDVTVFRVVERDDTVNEDEAKLSKADCSPCIHANETLSPWMKYDCLDEHRNICSNDHVYMDFGHPMQVKFNPTGHIKALLQVICAYQGRGHAWATMNENA